MQCLELRPWSCIPVLDPTCSWSFGILVYKVCSLGKHVAWLGHGVNGITLHKCVCLSYVHAGASPFSGISPGDIYREIGAGKRPSTLGCCSGDMYVLKCACVVWTLIWGMRGRVLSLGCLQNFSSTALLAALTHR